MSTNDQQSNQSNYQSPRIDAKHAVEPSGPKGDDPSTAGPGPTKVSSNTPENNLGHINPSAPEDANTTPGSTGKK
ncbi:hypothetical protein [Tunturiibacter gelidoferens]|jgi:hypothetical protein|uniref:Uncharacterized protein n=1 Tax=Tunturiibacter gelidiferens TaxID=3069689 RepID=A0A9X0U219_9BACT|nr:hypothetical protein [Edaphobacter lichenicola]MBB5326843.1 hypothetical protein [Edaphobacter lichenicola]